MGNMILSFNPIFSGDKNLVCAGRDPGDGELAALRAAAAVILPQGCPRKLYEMARMNCSRVFPNYDARFRYPGKIGQIRLFRETAVRHPRSLIFSDSAALQRRCPDIPESLPFGFPFVFKFDWGGEGETVFLIRSETDFKAARRRAFTYERTGQKGFILQEYIPTRRRSLRAVVIGRHYLSYWRIQPDPNVFQVNLARGARIDKESSPERQREVLRDLEGFCEKTGIDLAGFDFLISTDSQPGDRYFLEINYFFGRTGLGGQAVYYKLLTAEIDRWLKRHGLRVGKPA
jgi:ribosomal protein S6--L-glutamate ligase